MKKIILLFLAGSFLLTLSCSFDADRDNPIDPNSNVYFNPASVTGVVLRKSGSPISNVEASLSPGNHISVTNNNGQFFLYNITAGPKTIKIEHPDYDYIEMDIFLNTGVEFDTVFTLDAKPVIDSASVTSQNILIDPQLYEYDSQVYIYANIFDPDGSTEMDSSEIKVSYFDNLITLNNISGSIYEYTIDEDDFPGGMIDSLLNVPFTLFVIDPGSDTTWSNPLYINAVLAFRIFLSKPIPGTVFYTGNPYFEWNYSEYNNTYFYHKQILSIRNEFPSYLVYEKALYDTTEHYYENIFTEIAYDTLLDDTLNPGRYTWTIRFANLFGDFVQSDEAVFEISD